MGQNNNNIARRISQEISSDPSPAVDAVCVKNRSIDIGQLGNAILRREYRVAADREK
jgi:hypothetical protein